MFRQLQPPVIRVVAEVGCVTVVVVIGEVSHVRLGFVAAPHVRLFIFFIFLPKMILLFFLFGVTKGISKGFNS